ncbi:MAG: 1-(5-phosphoribosyl)-5-[(5-phosphoribosylamino)methylideneamino]imidazole-4-carboxamide isomerase [Oscillospiraceae bacterium]|nr:1-(5-phosphoribosyl)-5-[(5-phosphoribosylamino)methylideneamino]imidazole-4-carboxamide isomerase [Oscillospiraceae bacterium]
MIIFPAIDLFEGKAVRLLRGDYARMTVYSDDPPAVARGFIAAGAKHIHLVDLEGARSGRAENFDTVREIISLGLRAEVGGGIRTAETAERYLDAGAERVILGTAALEDEKLLRELVHRRGDAIAVGVDMRDGYVAVKGWTSTSEVSGTELMERLADIGIRHVICTDISRDGAMGGTNRELYRELAARFDTDITASGGISTLDDIRALRDMGLYGAILGKALYTGDIDLKQALEAAEEKGTQ